jgi:hypothetical protein
MVPPTWEHPRDERGNFIPLFGRSYVNESREWDESAAKWAEGLMEDYSKWSPGQTDKAWQPIEGEYREMTYADYAGERPDPDDYMPDWPAEERTHYQMYEDTSEGTPISPIFDTPEKLARWLADTKASAFAGHPASYEGWLRVAKGGFAPSMVVADGKAASGVDGL